MYNKEKRKQSSEVFKMQYEAICTSCKKPFKLVEGEEQYKLMKERKSHLFYCDDCKHKIRFDAIRNFFRYY